MTDIVNVPAIPALPTPPSTNDPNNFAARADGFLGILPEWSARMGEVAEAAKTNATASQEHASASQTAANWAESNAADAAASAELAKNAPTTHGTSNQTLAIEAGSIDMQVESGRAFISGQAVVIAAISNPTSQRMYGIVTAYNQDSGALTVAVSQFSGVGSATGWTVVLGNAPAVGGLSVINVTTNSLAVSGLYHAITEPNVSLAMPAFPKLGDEVGFCNASAGNVIVQWNGATVKGVVPVPTAMVVPQYGAAVVRFNGSTWV